MKSIVRILAGLALLVIAVLVFLFLLQPKIPLGALSGPVSSLLTFISGNEQVIRGNFFLIPGTWTTISVENGSLELTGKDAFTLKTEINSAQATLHLWSLFTKEINVDGIAVHGMTLGVHLGNEKDTSAADNEKEGEDHSSFIPFNLQQTGTINLADITAAILLSEPEKKVTFRLVRGTGEFSREATGKLTIEAIMDDKEFRTNLEGGPLADLAALDSDWPFSIHLSHKSVTIDVIGSVTGGSTDPQVKADISLSGENFDDLVSIFGSQGSRNQPFALQGVTTLSREDIQVDISKVQAGSEILQLSGSIKDYRASNPHYNLAARGDRLNLDALKGFVAGDEPKAASAQSETKSAQISRDDIIFPGTFPLKNLNLDLDLKELVMAGKQIKDIQLNFAMAGGIVTESPFQATFPNAALSGHYKLNLGAELPRLSAHLDAKSFNIGGLLKELQLADDSVMHIENVTTDIDTSGRTLGKLYDNLVFTIKANGGKYEYRDPNTGTVIPVILNNTKITGEPGEKITATFQGKINDNPTSITLDIDDHRDEPPGSIKDLSFTEHIQIAGTQLEFSGKIPLPLRMEGITVHSKFSGERLDSLNELLHLQLPEIGPYEVDGKFSIVPEGYQLNDILIQLGSSSLKGDISVDTKAVPPLVRIDLHSPVIQLDDFRAIQVESNKTDSDSQTPKEEESTEHDKKQYLTDQEILDRFNATVNIEVKEVLSGEDYLGSGTLNIEQKNGRFMIHPLNLQSPGGTVNVDYSLEPSSTNRLYHLDILIEDLDYGVVGRWFKPDTDMSGIINLRTSLESESPDWQSIMAKGNGYFDFSIQPKQLRSGVIDLWAVNLFTHLIPFLTPKGESKINCAAGRFNLENGILKQEELLIDTSKIRVKGTVEVDFNRQWINAILRPIPKRPQFLSLSTPIEIDGSFSDLDIGVATGGMISTVIRLATSYVVVPLQWIIQNKLPEDGTEACLQLTEERTE